MIKSKRSAYQQVSAKNFLYKLRGSSQPSIIQGSDGDFYVLKLMGRPGDHSLINEAVGSDLIRSLGLPSPDWTPIEVSEDFIDENRGLWFYVGNFPVRPLPGRHFGSRLIEAADDSRTYQMIPHSWIDRIENGADFLGVLILDLWANSCDRRQAIFLADAENRLRATFIDNDSLFGGKYQTETTVPRRAMVYDLDIYEGLWSGEIVKEWLGKIDGIGEDAIRRALANVPDEWKTRESGLHIINQLTTRRKMLPGLLRDAKNVLSTGYSIQYHRACHATEPSRLHIASILPALQP